MGLSPAPTISQAFNQREIPNPPLSVPIDSHTLARLSTPLTLPPGPPQLTRSQRVFALTTRIDPRSLILKDASEFYLFMEMRAEMQWVSFKMTGPKWVTATLEYNRRLTEKNAKDGRPTIEKSPLALMKKLGEIEPGIIARIAGNNFTCEYLLHSHCMDTQCFNSQAQFGFVLDNALLCSAFG
jgi:hypothetical protein